MTVSRRDMVTAGLVLAPAAALAASSSAASAQNGGVDPFMAEIRLFAFDFARPGWAACRGQMLPIDQNVALFALLGTMHGGDGQNSFALPEIPAPVGLQFCIATHGVFPARS